MPSLSAYVSNEIYSKYKKIAKQKNLTLSKLVKQALEKSKFVDEKKILATETKRLQELQQIKYKIDGVTHNYNQVTKYINTQKALDYKVLQELRSIKNDLENISRWLDI